jgi:small subunit ribosomal protein S9
MEMINAIGRRKASIARVFLKKGKGKVTINKKELKEYMVLENMQQEILAPLKMTGLDGKYDVVVNVNGGGFKGQTEAIRLGISRAVVKIDEENKPVLKAVGYMTRDSRVVERKKPGRRKARKVEQFSKR